jgi:hypothetical protein
MSVMIALRGSRGLISPVAMPVMNSYCPTRERVPAERDAAIEDLDLRDARLRDRAHGEHTAGRQQAGDGKTVQCTAVRLRRACGCAACNPAHVSSLT